MIYYVALGSALGGVARFVFGGYLQRLWGPSFPVGTLAVNVLGSLLIGFVFRLCVGVPAIPAEARVFLTTGFCGGYTTFSTFSFETAELLESGAFAKAGLYALVSVALCCAATFTGFAIARQVVALRRLT